MAKDNSPVTQFPRLTKLKQTKDSGCAPYPDEADLEGSVSRTFREQRVCRFSRLILRQPIESPGLWAPAWGSQELSNLE